jgi:hypothetical protein
MNGGRRNDISAVTSNVEAVPDFTSAIWYRAPWMREVDVRTSASCRDSRRIWQSAISELEFPERFVAAMTWVDVQHDDSRRSAGRNRQVRVRISFPPSADPRWVIRCFFESTLNEWSFGALPAWENPEAIP